jgi:hypothetical protein
MLDYRKIVEIRHTVERTGRDLRREEFFRLKGEIDPSPVQIALEQLRLVSPPETVEIAQAYEQHLRAGEATRDSRAVFDAMTWKLWSGQFWGVRKELINRGRLDQGIGPTSAEAP